MDIAALGRVQSTAPLNPAAATTPKKGLGNFITEFSEEVNNLQHQADRQIADLAAGKTDNLHQVMLTLGKAELSFKFMLETRNRLIDAYREVMRMSV